MRYQTVLFDLDGTLIDSEEGVLNSVKHALKTLGAPIPPMEELRRFIGPPLKEAFEEVCGFSPEQAVKAVAIYRERYRPIGVYECRMYDGVPTLLAALKAAGCRVCLATSKPREFALLILKKLEIERYFDLVAGADIGGPLSDKVDVLRDALSKLPTDAKESMVMVGDRCYDVEGATVVGIPCIGVLYGFGTIEEFAEAETAVSTVEALQAYLLEE